MPNKVVNARPADVPAPAPVVPPVDADEVISVTIPANPVPVLPNESRSASRHSYAIAETVRGYDRLRKTADALVRSGQDVPAELSAMLAAAQTAVKDARTAPRIVKCAGLCDTDINLDTDPHALEERKFYEKLPGAKPPRYEPHWPVANRQEEHAAWCPRCYRAELALFAQAPTLLSKDVAP